MTDLEIYKQIGGENFVPSKAQEEIFEFVKHGIGNGSVESRAGSGKSKTIELACHFIPSNKTVLVLAYNVHIATHLRAKLCSLKNVTVLTYHSLGYKLIKSFNNKVELDEKKYIQYINSHIEYLCPDFNTFSNADKGRYIKNIEKLLDYSRYNLMQSEKEIAKMAIKYGIKVFSNECQAVKKIMKWGCENNDFVDYQDMIWLPYELGIINKYLKFDMIFIDEAQDSSLAQQHLIDMCMKRNTRFLLFGDSQQMINAWAGSDEEAFTHFNNRPNVKKFKLTTSYRCSKKVADLAKTIVPDFEAYEKAIDGEINYNVPLNNIKPGDMVLCRLTSPLIKLYLKLMKEGKPVYIKGIEIGNNIIETVDSYKTNDLNVVINSLKKNLITKWEEIAEIYKTDLKSVVGESDVVTLYDEILTLELLSDGISSVDDLEEYVNEIFVAKTKEIGIDDDKYIHLSTVHRAKGLESNNVFILCPSLLPNKLAKKDWEIISEKNLVYVAWTRAKKTLNFISEKEFPPEKSYSGNDSLYNEFLKIKEDVEKK